MSCIIACSFRFRQATSMSRWRQSASESAVHAPTLPPVCRSLQAAADLATTTPSSGSLFVSFTFDLITLNTSLKHYFYVRLRFHRKSKEPAIFVLSFAKPATGTPANLRQFSPRASLTSSCRSSTTTTTVLLRLQTTTDYHDRYLHTSNIRIDSTPTHKPTSW